MKEKPNHMHVSEVRKIKLHSNEVNQFSVIQLLGNVNLNKMSCVISCQITDGKERKRAIQNHAKSPNYLTLIMQFHSHNNRSNLRQIYCNPNHAQVLCLFSVSH